MIRAKEKKIPVMASREYTHQYFPPINFTSMENERAAMERKTTINARARVITRTVNSGTVIKKRPTREVMIPKTRGQAQRDITVRLAVADGIFDGADLRYVHRYS